MSWKKHKLNQIQRYVQGVGLLGKYARFGRPDWTKPGDHAMLIITSESKVLPEHGKLLNYLGWTQIMELTPYIGEYENHYELYWQFQDSDEVWVED